jgi:hypothetical protein
MASIVLSFVGQQDPVSDNTRSDGSIVTLVRHLLEQTIEIDQIVLLYTHKTRDRAELTQGWLMEPPFGLAADSIALLPVGDELSNDPVNVRWAVLAARRGLEMALEQAGGGDRIELNASSGTPVMKSAWSILQAAGYAPRSRVWQVRNPQEQRPEQQRVFQANVAVLKLEFDVRVIKQQLQDYNYSGAAVSLRESGLETPILSALLLYGHCRRSLDFRGARQAIAPVRSQVSPQWYEEVVALERRDAVALLQEAYFSAVLELKNQQFSNFLVRVSQFQEQALQYCVADYLGVDLPSLFADTEIFWSSLERQQSALYAYLGQYQVKGYPLRLAGFPSRLVLLAILEFGQDERLAALGVLGQFCERRNRYVHQFEGVSELTQTSESLRAMRSLLDELNGNTESNPFNRLNQAIEEQLAAVMQE